MRTLSLQAVGPLDHQGAPLDSAWRQAAPPLLPFTERRQ